MSRDAQQIARDARDAYHAKHGGYDISDASDVVERALRTVPDAKLREQAQEALAYVLMAWNVEIEEAEPEPGDECPNCRCGTLDDNKCCAGECGVDFKFRGAP